MQKTCCFFGHREIKNKVKVYEKLKCHIIVAVMEGYNNFLVGSHGEFDELVYKCLIEVKHNPYFNDFNINIVFTDKKLQEIYKRIPTILTKFYTKPKDDKTNYITYSNKQMINESELVITYVNEKKKTSGAKTAMSYAKDKKIKIINLYSHLDDFLCSDLILQSIIHDYN